MILLNYALYYARIMLDALATYYAQNYASIICQGLLKMGGTSNTELSIIQSVLYQWFHCTAQVLVVYTMLTEGSRGCCTEYWPTFAFGLCTYTSRTASSDLPPPSSSSSSPSQSTVSTLVSSNVCKGGQASSP